MMSISHNFKNTQISVKSKLGKSFLNKFVQSISGQSMTEYALIIALVAVVGIGAISLLGTDVRDVFTSITDAI
jgi:pilus assembly protein Flp/PilA